MKNSKEFELILQKKGLNFKDLYCLEGLEKIDLLFLEHLELLRPDLYNQLITARIVPFLKLNQTSDFKAKALECTGKYITEPATCEITKDHLRMGIGINDSSQNDSDFLMDLAIVIQDFLGDLFQISLQLNDFRNDSQNYARLYEAKRLFIQRKALKKYSKQDSQGFDIENIIQTLSIAFVVERSELKQFTLTNLPDLLQNEEVTTFLEQYIAHLCHNHHNNNQENILLNQPHKLNYEHLINPETIENRDREGLNLSDHGGSKDFIFDNANYCIYCHNQSKDSCSKGMKSNDNFKTNALDITLTGCPLDEKISEMNKLTADGFPLAALAIVMLDNPLCPATGHRICNDCMKSCIYQKQDPVNIPEVETGVLKEILYLPFGFEIYSLLCKWNPLLISAPVATKRQQSVLVAGLGPAGFSTSYYLCRLGYNVVAIDGLKIEPLPEHISGRKLNGDICEFTPIKHIECELFDNLHDRIIYGFGGVAEYGITVRWNKNYLKVIRTMLQRMPNFYMSGGLRFGSNITYQQAKNLGFNHIALAFGAGSPNLPDIKNLMCRGVRTASDFLMTLQLGGAYKADLLSNLQIRMPIVVIGGGLTAIDTATEAQNYYLEQIKIVVQRVNLLKNIGVTIADLNLNEEELAMLNEFLVHETELKNSSLSQSELLRKWGASHVIYRKTMQDAPSYRLNHEEVAKAFEEGIYFHENLTPIEVLEDCYGHCSALKILDHNSIASEIPCRTLLIATGTKPNTILADEDSLNFKRSGLYFQSFNEHGTETTPEKSSKTTSVDIFTKIDGVKVSFLGDLHPSFAGNVVKAIASAKKAAPIIDNSLKNEPIIVDSREITSKFITETTATVKEVKILAPKIIEIVFHAPLAAQNFKPGQFYRLQNYLSNCKKAILGDQEFSLAMEPLALTGASVSGDEISLIALEMGGSSNFCRFLEVGEQVVLMGPTGTASEIDQKLKIVLIGGGLGNAVLFSIGKALKNAGSEVIYFAGYRKKHDLFKMEEIEEAANQVIWVCDEALISPKRAQDLAYHGNILQAMKNYRDLLKHTDKFIVIGSNGLMQAVAEARHELFPENTQGIASINSPMQCMMKEICGQCLQKHIDSKTGQEYFVYSCNNQDQNISTVDFTNLSARLKQNSLQEKIAASIINNAMQINR